MSAENEMGGPALRPEQTGVDRPEPGVRPPDDSMPHPARGCAHQFDDRMGSPCLICGARPWLRDDETPFPSKRLTDEERAAIEAFIIESGIRP